MSSNIVLVLPKSYDDIVNVFGCPPENPEERIVWEDKNLFYFVLPFEVKSAWDTAISIKVLRFHKKLQDVVHNTFNFIKSEGLNVLIEDCGGAYFYRTKRNNNKQLSTHAFGIAIDINCLRNPYGAVPTQPYLVVSAFLKFGWVWGGFWKNKDGMHFQFAGGY